MTKHRALPCSKNHCTTFAWVHHWKLKIVKVDHFTDRVTRDTRQLDWTVPIFFPDSRIMISDTAEVLVWAFFVI